MNETIGEENFTRIMEEENRFEFNAMDTNGDGKVSQQEAYNYAGYDMPQADIDFAEFHGMFKEADTDGDNFLSYKEFVKAGEGYEGDGDEMSEAPPMTLFINVKKRNFLVARMMKKRMAKRARVHGARMPKRRFP